MNNQLEWRIETFACLADRDKWWIEQFHLFAWLFSNVRVIISQTSVVIFFVQLILHFPSILDAVKEQTKKLSTNVHTITSESVHNILKSWVIITIRSMTVYSFFIIFVFILRSMKTRRSVPPAKSSRIVVVEQSAFEIVLLVTLCRRTSSLATFVRCCSQSSVIKDNDEWE